MFTLKHYGDNLEAKLDRVTHAAPHCDWSMSRTKVAVVKFVASKRTERGRVFICKCRKMALDGMTNRQVAQVVLAFHLKALFEEHPEMVARFVHLQDTKACDRVEITISTGQFSMGFNHLNWKLGIFRK